MKPKSLVPGRIITQKVANYDYDVNGQYRLITTILPWMIVSVEETVWRRHSKKTAPPNGWNILMIQFGKSDFCNIKTFHINPDGLQVWKSLF
jgi:hypothetical protein